MAESPAPVRFGMVFPHYELDADGPAPVVEYAQAVEAAGFTHLALHDHVLGADSSVRPDWSGPYNTTHTFHEPFVLFGFLAAVTQHLELMTDILILPQRQTALTAKQAAEADVLSQGRLRLGIGIGWNAVEYEALGVDWATRGARLEEQVDVLRLLWTQESVSYSGRFHTINHAGIRPLPVQRPIPLWFGGGYRASPRALDRIGRLADGWLPNLVPGGDDDQLRRTIDAVMAAAAGPDRQRGALEVEGMVSVDRPLDLAATEARVQAWLAFGATRITFRGLDICNSFAEHLDLVRTLGATYCPV